LGAEIVRIFNWMEECEAAAEIRVAALGRGAGGHERALLCRWQCGARWAAGNRQSNVSAPLCKPVENSQGWPDAAELIFVHKHVMYRDESCVTGVSNLKA
jgi:hypothetical protein